MSIVPHGACDCPIERALSVLEGRWTLLVLRELFQGTQRFGQMRKNLPGISPKTLTDRLRCLETHGVIEREIFAEIPPRVEYRLTPHGRAAWPVLEALGDWGGRLASERGAIARFAPTPADG